MNPNPMQPLLEQNPRKRFRAKTSDIIPGLIFLAIGASYFFCPSLIEVLVSAGILNLLVATVKHSETRVSVL